MSDDSPIQDGDAYILCKALRECTFTFMLHDLKWYERIYWRMRGYDAYMSYIEKLCNVEEVIL